MKSANTLSDSIICGEAVTLRRLLRWVTGTPMNRELELPTMISGQELAFSSASRVPPNQRLLFTEQQDWNEYSNRRATFFVLESRPFAKEETLKRVHHIQDQVDEASILVVLMEQPHRVAYTDLTTSGEDLSEAQRLFRQKHIETMRLTERENLRTGISEFVLTEFLDVLNWEEAWDLTWEKHYNTVLDGIKFLADPTSFSTEFKIALENSIPETGELNDYLGICGDVSMAQIISYRSLTRHRKVTIWENYSAELERRMFPKDQQGGIYPIINWFREVMECDYIPGWNAKQDSEQLTQILRRELRAELSKARAASLRKQRQWERKVNTSSEENYKRMISDKTGPDSHIQADFPEAVRRFVNHRLPALIYARINARVSIVETAYHRFQQAEGVRT